MPPPLLRGLAPAPKPPPLLPKPLEVPTLLARLVIAPVAGLPVLKLPDGLVLFLGPAVAPVNLVEAAAELVGPPTGLLGPTVGLVGPAAGLGRPPVGQGEPLGAGGPP
jgi:hypothetical protein